MVALHKTASLPGMGPYTRILLRDRPSDHLVESATNHWSRAFLEYLDVVPIKAPLDANAPSPTYLPRLQ